MALKALPFRGVRFDFKRTSVGQALCPPYDVISTELGRKLRSRPSNAIHVELPPAKTAAGYRRAKMLWQKWRKSGVLVADSAPAYYLVEQAFKFAGRKYTRSGFFTALGLDGATAARVLRHEKTLAKPKKDRTRVLKTMQVNTSPIFGIYRDNGGRMRREIDAAKRAKPLAQGKDLQGVGYRIWRVDDVKRTARLAKAFAGKKVLIADGHHRYEVARDFWRKTRRKGAESILAYLVAEEDRGLIVNPTHRVVKAGVAVKRALAKYSAPRRVAGLKALERALDRAASPYAFGLVNGATQVCLPVKGDKGVKSRFGADWLKRRLLGSVDPQDISYYHGAGEAVRAAKKLNGGVALLLKDFSVKDIRVAVERAGLMPQKSTYFFPKIATGVVFRAFKA